MAQKIANIEQLISRKITGDITPAEMQQLFNWIAEDEKNAAIYQKMMKAVSCQQRQLRKSSIWHKVKNKTHKELYFNTKRIVKVVAMLTLIALIPLALGKYGEDDSGHSFIHTVKGNGVVTSFYLPDGSKVFLSRGSEIRYNDSYNESNRELLLEGKAYIEIDERSTHLPLIVNSGKRCAIAHKGKIAIDGNTNHFDVAVEEGEATVVDTLYKRVIIPMYKLQPAIRVNDEKTESLFESTKISQGQRAIYSTMNNMAKTSVNNYCDVFSWKDKVFCFNNLKQHELAFKISEWYGKRVEFKGELNPYKNYSGSFDNPRANDLIKEVFGTNVTMFKETKKKITVTFS